MAAASRKGPVSSGGLARIRPPGRSARLFDSAVMQVFGFSALRYSSFCQQAVMVSVDKASLRLLAGLARDPRFSET